MNVSIVIPNYNGEQVLKETLPVVIKNSANCEIIVVDDGSTDKSVDYIKTSYPQVKLITKKQNSGFSPTVNLGVKKAKGDLIVLFNHDVYPKKGWLKPLLPHFKNPKVFAVGCLEESLEKNQVILKGRGVGSFSRGFLTHSRGKVNKTSTLWVSGGSGIFKKSIWQKLGGLDEVYSPFYWEDIDLSYRAVKSGYKILFEPKSRVVHQHHKGSIKNQHSQKSIKTIAYRNQLVFFWKNITSFKLWFKHLFWLPYHLASALIRSDWQFFKGFAKALTKIKQIFKLRQKQIRLYKISDQQVIKKALK